MAKKRATKRKAVKSRKPVAKQKRKQPRKDANQAAFDLVTGLAWAR